jgi:hypothetical protein
MAKEKKTVKAIIPLEDFQKVYAFLPESSACRAKWCAYSRTTCHVREAREGIRAWWKRVNGDAPGFAMYESVLQNAIRVENELYWCFWTHEMKPCEELYKLLAAAVRDAFRGKPLDKERSFM